MKIIVEDSVIQQALEALRQGVKRLNHLNAALDCVPLHEGIAALCAILESAEKAEPVAYIRMTSLSFGKGMTDELFKASITDEGMPVFAAPVAAEDTRLKQLWFSDADPEETEYAAEYRATMGEKK